MQIGAKGSDQQSLVCCLTPNDSDYTGVQTLEKTCNLLESYNRSTPLSVHSKLVSFLLEAELS